MKLHKPFLFVFLLMCVGHLHAQSFSISPSITQATCNNSDAAISVSVTGGMAPYSYEWRENDFNGPVFSTASSISNLAPGMYFVKVTDSGNKYLRDSVFVSNGIYGSASTISKAICPQQNGVVQASAQGGQAPYTYLWSNGATTKVVSNLAAGTFMQVEIKDANGCSAYGFNYKQNIYSLVPTTIFETTVEETSTIVTNYTSTPEECPLNNGTATVTASGGIAPYSYYWNTTPAKNTATITDLTNGYYTATVTDAEGCKQTTYVIVEKNAGALNASATKTNDNCSKNQGTANISITGGVAPYTVLWPDGSSALNRTDLGYGFYNVKVTDQNSCVFNLQIFIDDLSPVYSWITATETNCDNISGTALANAVGGNAPYTYEWSTGATNASINGLPTGYYSVLIKDANGCKSSAWNFVRIKSSCFAFVSGKIFQDDNGNCIQDVTDHPILNQYAYMNGSSAANYLYDYYSGTDNNGDYSLRYVLPDQYRVGFYTDVAARTAACPSTGAYNLNIPVSGVNYLNKDFAMQPSSLFEDVALVYNFCNSYTPPRPGFNYSYAISFKNNGTLFSDGFIEVVYGNMETFVTSSPAADFYDPATKTLRFNYQTLMLGEKRNIILTFNLPPTTLLGSRYNHIVKADIGTTDPTPENNEYSYPFLVVGSYDPNDLRVNPDGFITEEQEELTYFIRFQNTGTYPAELVVVTDVIDQNLDITSIKDITASHQYKFSVRDGRKVEFAFENINLADVKRDEPGSHGYVTFKIKKKKNLPLGTEIKNTANIYFDYNDPIITNTTVNTIGIETGVTDSKEKLQGMVYPNPAKNYTTFRFDTAISTLQLTTVTGAQVLNQQVDNQKTFNVPLNLSKGMYIYKAMDENGNAYSGKLIIE